MSAARTRIKICGLTREQDVDAAVAAGADAIGLVLYAKSPRCVTPERAGVLARRLPPFVTPVLLFVNETAANVRAACEQVPHALLQFHGDETPQQCIEAAAGRPWMRAARIPVDPAVPFDLLKFAADYSQAQALLLDAHVEGFGGAGKTFPWSRLPPNASFHAVLSGGLTPANVGDGIAQVRPRFATLAVDVSSGVESSKGIKDAGRIHQFVAAVRAADERLARSPHVPLPAA
ncbi:phosphoribosylanthranilate isomerase [Ramlibacter sp. USB13]|uniref:N-(5'-phosphoribosyl)anthranilate isomerase n=1 Tax=Ramlibacter cellulosilyticus TaxID=2764187 RepID=A0A923MMZ2_9BURK|nr:phosphoribosylanthranilate isomerase [Ramlibacter cellulosilyticus]MBC5782010.1 phosphoribosylanthranilate isomerase [Ramlibacter cellulosilyticus]